ncbi:MAG: hypothetical protein U0930_11460 [Pirellulales bacterium]
MVKRNIKIYLLYQSVILFTVALLILLANIVPRAEVNNPASMDGQLALISNGKLIYGWPKTTHIDKITQTENFEPYLEPNYSFKHFVRLEKFQLASTHRSELAVVSNILLAVSILLLLGIGIHCLSLKQYSIRILLATITLVGIATASALFDCPM